MGTVGCGMIEPPDVHRDSEHRPGHSIRNASVKPVAARGAPWTTTELPFVCENLAAGSEMVAVGRRRGIKCGGVGKPIAPGGTSLQTDPQWATTSDELRSKARRLRTPGSPTRNCPARNPPCTGVTHSFAFGVFRKKSRAMKKANEHVSLIYSVIFAAGLPNPLASK